MILSLLLIYATITGVTPWILFALLITWLPDVVLIGLLAGNRRDF